MRRSSTVVPVLALGPASASVEKRFPDGPGSSTVVRHCLQLRRQLVRNLDFRLTQISLSLGSTGVTPLLRYYEPSATLWAAHGY